MRRIRLVVLAGLFVLSTAAVAGCSSAQALGLGGPAHRLLPETKSVRDAAPVPAPVPRELNRVLLPAHTVEPGDTLLVQPAELDAPVRLPPDQPVLPDGTIDLARYGRPVVAGKTVPEIEAQIQALVKAKEKDAKDPILINVRLIGRVSKVYYVLGEVNAPGTGRETVLDAINVAGGLTRNASEQNVVLSRPTPPDGCRVVYPVCYSNIVQLGDTTTNYQIMPGDRIFVPSKGMFEGIFPHADRKHACPACLRPQYPCAGCGDPVIAPPATIGAPGVLPPPIQTP
jgi:polysaccharide biosynthesis/export protein